VDTPAPLRPKGLAWIIGLLLFTFVATLAYWIIYFTSGDVQVRHDEVYLAFENAFPLADAWMAICALLGAIGLWKKQSWGGFIRIAGGFQRHLPGIDGCAV
jgi:hypothetical protein